MFSAICENTFGAVGALGLTPIVLPNSSDTVPNVSTGRLSRVGESNSCDASRARISSGDGSAVRGGAVAGLTGGV
jgi:hypothetical protein